MHKVIKQLHSIHQQMIGLTMFVLLLVGGVASVLLVGRNSELRQQASVNPYGCNSPATVIIGGVDAGACKCPGGLVIEVGQTCPVVSASPTLIAVNKTSTPVPTLVCVKNGDFCMSNVTAVCCDGLVCLSNQTCGQKTSSSPTPIATVNQSVCTSITNASQCASNSSCQWVSLGGTCIVKSNIVELSTCNSTCPNGYSCFCPQLTCQKAAIGPTDVDRICGVRVTATTIPGATPSTRPSPTATSKPTTYACINGACVLKAGGDYENLTTCAQYCRNTVPNSPTPTLVALGSSCSKDNQCFTHFCDQTSHTCRQASNCDYSTCKNGCYSDSTCLPYCKSLCTNGCILENSIGGVCKSVGQTCLATGTECDPSSTNQYLTCCSGSICAKTSAAQGYVCQSDTAQTSCDTSKCPGGCSPGSGLNGSSPICNPYCSNTKCPNGCLTKDSNGGTCATEKVGTGSCYGQLYNGTFCDGNTLKSCFNGTLSGSNNCPYGCNSQVSPNKCIEYVPPTPTPTIRTIVFCANDQDKKDCEAQGRECNSYHICGPKVTITFSTLSEGQICNVPTGCKCGSGPDGLIFSNIGQFAVCGKTTVADGATCNGQCLPTSVGATLFSNNTCAYSGEQGGGGICPLGFTCCSTYVDPNASYHDQQCVKSYNSTGICTTDCLVAYQHAGLNVNLGSGSCVVGNVMQGAIVDASIRIEAFNFALANWGTISPNDRLASIALMFFPSLGPAAQSCNNGSSSGATALDCVTNSFMAGVQAFPVVNGTTNLISNIISLFGGEPPIVVTNTVVIPEGEQQIATTWQQKVTTTQTSQLPKGVLINENPNYGAVYKIVGDDGTVYARKIFKKTIPMDENGQPNFALMDADQKINWEQVKTYIQKGGKNGWPSLDNVSVVKDANGKVIAIDGYDQQFFNNTTTLTQVADDVGLLPQDVDHIVSTIVSQQGGEPLGDVFSMKRVETNTNNILIEVVTDEHGVPVLGSDGNVIPVRDASGNLVVHIIDQVGAVGGDIINGGLVPTAEKEAAFVNMDLQRYVKE